jgi:hypothetical protein
MCCEECIDARGKPIRQVDGLADTRRLFESLERGVRQATRG